LEGIEMLFGERIYLRLMEERDIPFRVKWINDPDVRKTLNFDYPVSEIATKHWLNKVALDGNRRDFIVCLKENDNPIGYGGLLHIDRKNSKAESYMAIGEKDKWGKGFAKDIRKVLLSYAFIEIGINKVYSYVWSENSKMIKLNENVGFQIEGRLSQDVFSHGEYRDRVIMGVLKDNYLKNLGE
jgi:RimJ/RimL family protein N-acetyltransferase